jgi:hypothetical protein
MPINSDQREQFYLEASLLKLKNIYSKWQVKNQRESSSTVHGCQPAQAQEYLQQVAGKEPEREQFYLEASLLKPKNIYSKWQVKNQ